MTIRLIGEIPGAPFEMPYTLHEEQSISSAIEFALANPGIRDFAIIDDGNRVTGFLPMRELGRYTLTRLYPKYSPEIPMEHILNVSIVKTISQDPITARFEDPVKSAIKKIMSRVASEVHLVDADDILLGALTLEELFTNLRKEGLMKNL